MNGKPNAVLLLLARLMIVGVFAGSVIPKVTNFDGTAGGMAGEGIPMPKVALVGAIAFLVLGSISVVLGFKARIGAVLLLVFLALATFYFHDFWNFSGDAAGKQQIQFMKNLAIGGGLLYVIAAGPGPLGFAVKRKKAD